MSGRDIVFIYSLSIEAACLSPPEQISVPSFKMLVFSIVYTNKEDPDSSMALNRPADQPKCRRIVPGL